MEPYHPVVQKIKDLLTERAAWFETFEHEPVRTSEEAAQVRSGYGLHQGAKALIVRVKQAGVGKKFIMLVISGDKRFNADAVKALGFSDVRFATEVEVREITGGVLPGGVPPFGTLFGLEVFVDEGVMANEKIIFNAGDRRYSVGMLSKDYFDIVQPRVVTIAE